MSQDFPFNPTNFKFDINNAYSLAKVSQLVYTRFEEKEETRLDVISKVKKWGFTKVYLFDYQSSGVDSQAMVLADDDKIVVAFRGTEPSRLQDLLTDLDLGQINKLKGRVHRGFYLGFTPLWTSKLRIWKTDQELTKDPGIKDVLENLLTTKKRPIFVTGHSLGGALAVLGAAACGLELKDQFQTQISLYTYGQPRVGDDNFNNSLLKNTVGIFRVVNNNDIVPKIPVDFVKQTPAIDYSHAGKLIYLDTTNKVHLQDLGWWGQSKDQFWGRIKAFGQYGLDGINDHDLAKYIAILEGAVNNPNYIV